MRATTSAEHEALIESMLLSAGADGRVTKLEVEVLFARIFARPELSTYEKTHLRQTVDRLAERVGRAASVSALCESIAERLPSATARETAFRGAVAVALADHKAHTRELRALKALSAALGLTDERVQSLFETAEREQAHFVPPA